MAACDLQKVARSGKIFATCDLLDGPFPARESHNPLEDLERTHAQLFRYGAAKIKHKTSGETTRTMKKRSFRYTTIYNERTNNEYITCSRFL